MDNLNFKEWFNKRSPSVSVRYFSKDGSLGLIINGRPYDYWIDAARWLKLRKQLSHKPGWVINQLKGYEVKPTNQEMPQEPQTKTEPLPQEPQWKQLKLF